MQKMSPILTYMHFAFHVRWQPRVPCKRGRGRYGIGKKRDGKGRDDGTCVPPFWGHVYATAAIRVRACHAMQWVQVVDALCQVNTRRVCVISTSCYRCRTAALCQRLQHVLHTQDFHWRYLPIYCMLATIVVRTHIVHNSRIHSCV